MDIQTVQMLDEYNRHVNKEMNAIIKGLNAEQWNRKFGGYFPSIHALCNHIYICDFNWLKRFSKLREFEFVKDTLFNKSIGFDAVAIGPIKDYIAKREALDEHIGKFVKEIKEEDLGKKLKYVDSEGNEYNIIFGVLIFHIFNHATHHRVMISLYLEEMGIANDYSNLVEIL